MSRADAEKRRFQVGQIGIDALSFAGALASIEALVRARRGGVVFTPNVDHVVSADENQAFRDAYERADLRLADGMPLVWLSRLLGPALPEKISGSDLVPRLLQHAAERAHRVFLFGGAPGSADIASERLRADYPMIQIAGVAAPRVEIDEPEDVRATMVAAIRQTQPDIILVGLGSPKQELWISQVARALAPAVLLGVGASIDFLAGAVPRAPTWMSSNGLEWLYRLTREPKRLAPRYLGRDPKFLGILARDVGARLARLGERKLAPGIQP